MNLQLPTKGCQSQSRRNRSCIYRCPFLFLDPAPQQATPPLVGARCQLDTAHSSTVPRRYCASARRGHAIGCYVAWSSTAPNRDCTFPRRDLAFVCDVALSMPVESRAPGDGGRRPGDRSALEDGGRRTSWRRRG